jgi:hypothetical protein
MTTPAGSGPSGDPLLGIRFCERCKGSIPESEFHDGHALHVGKKNVHVDCLLQRSALLPIAALVLGLFATGAVLYGLVVKTGPLAEEKDAITPAVEAAIGREWAAANARAADLVGGTEVRLDALRAEMTATLDGMRRELAAAADSAAKEAFAASARGAAAGETAERTVEALRALEARLAAAAEQGVGLDAKFNSLAEAVAALRKEVLSLRGGEPGK